MRLSLSLSLAKLLFIFYVCRQSYYWQNFHNSFLYFSHEVDRFRGSLRVVVGVVFFKYDRKSARRNTTQKKGNDVNRHLLRMCWNFVLNFYRETHLGFIGILSFLLKRTAMALMTDLQRAILSSDFDSVSYLLGGLLYTELNGLIQTHVQLLEFFSFSFSLAWVSSWGSFTNSSWNANSQFFIPRRAFDFS